MKLSEEAKKARDKFFGNIVKNINYTFDSDSKLCVNNIVLIASIIAYLVLVIMSGFRIEYYPIALVVIIALMIFGAGVFSIVLLVLYLAVILMQLILLNNHIPYYPYLLFGLFVILLITSFGIAINDSNQYDGTDKKISMIIRKVFLVVLLKTVFVATYISLTENYSFDDCSDLLKILIRIMFVVEIIFSSYLIRVRNYVKNEALSFKLKFFLFILPIVNFVPFVICFFKEIKL